MTRPSFHIALLALFLPLAAAAQPGVWRPLPEAIALSAAEDAPTLVYVQASWCAPCRRLERETFADPSVARRLARFVRARLTIDEHERTLRVAGYRLSEAEWAERLGAQATPSIVLLGPDGRLLGRHTGFLPPAGLLPILDAALRASAKSTTP